LNVVAMVLTVGFLVAWIGFNIFMAGRGGPGGGGGGGGGGAVW
jgi:hypothetical protein